MSPIQTADDPGWVDEYQAMLDAYREAGGNPTMLSAPNVAALVVSSNRVLARSEVPGVRLQVQERPTGIVAEIRVDPGARRDEPVHLCFGMLQAEGIQEIESSFEIGAGADVRFITHCTFPRATRLRHAMDPDIHIASDPSMEYTEGHYHGQQGGIEVVPRARIVVDDGARFLRPSAWRAVGWAGSRSTTTSSSGDPVWPSSRRRRSGVPMTACRSTRCSTWTARARGAS